MGTYKTDKPIYLDSIDVEIEYEYIPPYKSHDTYEPSFDEHIKIIRILWGGIDITKNIPEEVIQELTEEILMDIHDIDDYYRNEYKSDLED